MSMQEYAVNEYGLLMTDDMLKTIASQYFDDYTDEEYEEDPSVYHNELWDDGIITCISEFTGESVCINDNGNTEWGFSETYNDDVIYYVSTMHISTLFKAAYSNIGELVNEFKEKFGTYFPEDFDYRSHIRHIVGTYYG